jgi:hypothetical protein
MRFTEWFNEASIHDLLYMGNERQLTDIIPNLAKLGFHWQSGPTARGYLRLRHADGSRLEFKADGWIMRYGPKEFSHLRQKKYNPRLIAMPDGTFQQHQYFAPNDKTAPPTHNTDERVTRDDLIGLDLNSDEKGPPGYDYSILIPLGYTADPEGGGPRSIDKSDQRKIG